MYFKWTKITADPSSNDVAIKKGHGYTRTAYGENTCTTALAAEPFTYTMTHAHRRRLDDSHADEASGNCIATSGPTYLQVTPLEWNGPAHKEPTLVYGMYADSACNTRDGLTSAGLFSMQNVKSNTCIANEPSAGASVKVEYSSTYMEASLHLGSTTCASNAPINIDGVPGSCKKIPASIVALLNLDPQAPACSDVNSCYIYTFPEGAVGPASSSTATTMGPYATAAALLVSAFSLLA
jgi:hypothetical protein